MKYAEHQAGSYKTACSWFPKFGYCSQSWARCLFAIMGFSMVVIMVLLKQCFHTHQCSWPRIQQPRQIFSISSEFGDLTSQSCEPLHPRVVFYNRIFKAASTTMSKFFKHCSIRLGNLYTRDLTEEWENENISHPVLTSIQSQIAKSKTINKRLLAIAHLYFREEIKSTYINLLREPVTRFISHYYYCRSAKRWPIKLKRLKELGHFNVTIEECLEKQYEGCVWNHMTRFFCGPYAFCKTGNALALARAKHNMLHYYASVGVMEYINEFTAVLHKRLPDFVLAPPKTGMKKRFVTTGIQKKPIKDSTMQRIKSVNKADIELYKFAKDLFFKQAANCGFKINSFINE